MRNAAAVFERSYSYLRSGEMLPELMSKLHLKEITLPSGFTARIMSKLSTDHSSG